MQATVLPDGNYYLPASGEPFPPKWQHHHRMIASTIVPIIKCILGLNPGVIHYGTPRPRLDASLRRCTLRSFDTHAMQKVRFWDPEHWRFRAEETRTVADQMTHEEARRIMRRIANDYDRLAKLAEEQLAAQERGATGD